MLNFILINRDENNVAMQDLTLRRFKLFLLSVFILAPCTLFADSASEWIRQGDALYEKRGELVQAISRLLLTGQLRTKE